MKKVNKNKLLKYNGQKNNDIFNEYGYHLANKREIVDNYKSFSITNGNSNKIKIAK